MNVCKYLDEQGFKTVNVEGGMMAWEGETKPKTRGERSPSFYLYAGSQSPCAANKSSHMEMMSFMESSALVCGSSIAAW